MRDVKAVPPGSVEATVPVWADAASKVLELVRSRITNLITPQEYSRCPKCGSRVPGKHEYDPPNVEDVSAWPHPDTTPPIDLSELDRALERH